jgi:hypothetical protein
MEYFQALKNAGRTTCTDCHERPSVAPMPEETEPGASKNQYVLVCAACREPRRLRLAALFKKMMLHENDKESLLSNNALHPLPIDENTLQRVTKIALQIQKETQRIRACNEVGCALQERFGWCDEYGVYDGPEVRGRGRRRFRYEHRWNRLPNGTIVDATANQFGDLHPVRIIPRKDSRQKYYLTMIGKYENDIAIDFLRWDAEHPVWKYYKSLKIACSSAE